MTSLGTSRARILVGDAKDRLQSLEDGSVHTVVTSPPYWGLRDYGVDDQLGLEPTPEAYVENLVGVFREVRRVLRDDGTLWLNLGDTYVGGNGAQGKPDVEDLHDDDAYPSENPQKSVPGLKTKDMVGIPWRVAFALQEGGWWVRNEVTWHKTTVRPSSVKDRFTTSTEKVFLLSASEQYYFDHVPIREPSKSTRGSGNKNRKATHQPNQENGQPGSVPWENSPTRHPRDVWSMPTAQNTDVHTAVFPESLPRKCIQAGTSERGACTDCGAPLRRVTRKDADGRERTDKGKRHIPHLKDPDREPWRTSVEYETIGWQPTCLCYGGDPVPCTVLDPFLGAGTTMLVALQEGRDAVGVELNPEYARLAWDRVRDLAEMPRLDQVGVSR